MQQYFEYNPEVEKALRERKPVLALESTLITHGMPYPQNINIAKKMQEISRNHDVCPAIIAVIKGKIKIGLSPFELEYLVHEKSPYKASTRDLSYVISESLTAGTTVAATSFCAEYAGIKVFATGGIGGVHRGEDNDISADLVELARTPIAVVCSGAKAILDLPKTLEFLETFAVPVIGYRTNVFPAFYTRESKFELHHRIDELQNLANYVKTHWQIGLPSGMVIANPIPPEYELPYDLIEPVIIEALKTAEVKNITGKALTPFLLSELHHATEGQSMLANISLIENNVDLGAQLAKTIMSSG